MLHTLSNRGTPVSGDNITKFVRQNYKPRPPEPYRDETIQCRTSTTCQLGKPEDYWVTNFNRRQQNFDKGFYTAPTVPYRPIGGDLVLDSCELVLSSFSGNIDKKLLSRHPRRGTIFDLVNSQMSQRRSAADEKSEKETSSVCQDIDDTCSSAGYEDIKQLMRESSDRIVCVRAGRGYEDHVKALDEQALAEREAKQTDDTGMALQSLSTVFLPLTTIDGSSRGSSPGSEYVASTAKGAKKLGYSDTEKTYLTVCTKLIHSPKPPVEPRSRPSSRARKNSASPILRPRSVLKSDMNKFNLITCNSGFTAALLRKERQFRDHRLYLKWIHSILTAVHNMKLKDIKSKVPLTKEVVERLQKEGAVREDERSSRATPKSVDPVTSDLPVKRSRVQSNTPFLDSNEPSPRKKPGWINSVSKARKKAAILSRFCRPNMMSTTDAGSDDGHSTVGRISVFGTMKRMTTVDNIGKGFVRDSRRRSKNAMGLAGSDRPPLETWEDLLNVQRQEYKEEPQKETAFGFQVGVVTKFMRWYSKTNTGKEIIESIKTGRENESESGPSMWGRLRRASILPSSAGERTLPGFDRSTVSSPQGTTHDKAQETKAAEKEATPHHQPTASVTQQPTTTTEKVTKKLPIWQQVAQEKSTVFHNKKLDVPNPDTAIMRFRRDLNKLKTSLQKENTAELEKIVRERVATFRLKFSILDQEECSPLFEEQIHRIHQARENVNKTHLENFDIQPSKWYEELREKTQSLVSTFDQPQIVETITKLQTYAHMDNKTVPYAKAKLCLLMMSLPAYDICQIHVQRSLKFIFENILLGQEAQFEEWLDHRQIPYMVYSATRPRSAFSNFSGKDSH